MARLKWDEQGKRQYETGVDRGVLYSRDEEGAYKNGVPWNGLIEISESPTGAEPTPFYADNIKYLNLMSTEELEGTIQAYTYPEEFEVCDGSATPEEGVTIGQQTRATFGLSYRTILGNDVESNDYGYKIHLIYGALAGPSERTYQTINESPEPIEFSWDFTTTPVDVEGFKPSSTVTLDSTVIPTAKMKEIEDILYGSEEETARLPLPNEVLTIIGG